MSLFEQVTPSVRLAKNGTGIGVVTQGDRALLVDSGLDENLVRKVVNALANEGVSVAGIVNTHAHADHIGARRAHASLARVRASWSAGGGVG